MNPPDDSHGKHSGQDLGAGGQIGPYRILRWIGEGGMGDVYEAEQEQPIRRHVAVKVLKLGMDTKEVVARFESERQALAMMNHSNVAHVYDAGATYQGRPYFVMEYVPGIAITAYCESQRLSIAERLELFIPVCEAIQHAHHKGVIHRDIKPSNILVAVEDGRAVPKVIDFGVAKATTQRLTDKTLVTEFGQHVGTPEYMSPEQAEMSGLDIDTRTDVYALGMVLYELLVGVLPFDRSVLQQAGFYGLSQLLRDRDIPRPSFRAIREGETATLVAGRRRTDRGGLVRQLRGDIDWVMMKALEKDRTRRYASALDLAADLRRHLRNEPVTASPPSTRYQLAKFVRRHRVGVAAGLLVVLTVLLGLAGTFMGLMRALRAERTARTEAETARQVSNFLVDIFKVSDPGQDRASTVTARELLDRGRRQIHDGLQAQPLVRSRIMVTMGLVYRRLSLLDESQELLEEALKIQTAELGEECADAAKTLSYLGWLSGNQGAWDRGRDQLEKALRIQQRVVGPQHVDVAWTLYYLGDNRVFSGQSELGRPLLEQAKAIFVKQLGPEDIAVAQCWNDLGIAAWSLGHGEEAVADLRTALRIKEKTLGQHHFEVAIAMNNTGYILTMLGRYQEARPLLEGAVAIDEKVLEPGHPTTGMHLHSLGEVLRSLGEREKAASVLHRSLAIFESRRNSHGLGLALPLRSLALLAEGEGDDAEAEALFRRALVIQEASNLPGHPELLETVKRYASFMRKQGRYREADSTEAHAAALPAPKGS